MSCIPLARSILATLLPDLPEPARQQVEEALSHMTRRRPAKPRAPAQKRTVDPDMAARIREYVAAHPQANLQDVAVAFRTGLGRVSEALHHER